MDILSSDLLWSFFNVTLNSYKHDSLLRPFPPAYRDANDEKNFEDLRNLSDQVPQLNKVIWNEAQCLKLLSWVISPKKFTLSPISKKKINEIRGLVGVCKDGHECDPDYLFKVDHSHQDCGKFEENAEKYGMLYAYHGSRAENFHSILHNGLRNNLNKVSLFGEGIYLSSDLKVSQMYSTSAANSEKSLLGNALSCVAVCQLINHPDLKCGTASEQGIAPNQTASGRQSCAEQSASTLRKKRSFIKGSEGGEIPDRYFVVRNDDWVKVKYLLVFAPNSKHDLIVKLTTGKCSGNSTNVVRQFLQRHKLTLAILCYVLILFFINLFNK